MKHRSALFLGFLALAACEQDRLPEMTAMPVRVEKAARSSFAPELALIGVVRPAQTIPLMTVQGGTITFAPRFAGGLRTGETVVTGETIAEIRNDQVAFARTEAKLRMEAADAEFERARRSFEQGLVSSAQYSSAEVQAKLAHETYNATLREFGKLRVIAPARGRLIVAKTIPPGVVVDPGALLGEIASSGAPIVESAVAAGDRDLLRPGLAVRFSGPGRWSGEGRITEVSSVIDAAGTARVVAVIEGTTAPAPGVGVDLVVELDAHPDVLTLPEDAIVAGAEGPAVFVMGQQQGFERGYRVKRVAVETGGRANGRIEIVAGLADGDRVVITGADTLTDDTLVTESK